jgi:hypothetical protein
MLYRLPLWPALLALLIAAPAKADSVDPLRLPLLNGQYDLAVQSQAPSADQIKADPNIAAFAIYYRGLGAFAQRDFGKTVADMLTITQQHGDKPIALKAAVVATLALSRQGDHKNACQYIGVVSPLVGSLSPIWQAWVEEARRASACQ